MENKKYEYIYKDKIKFTFKKAFGLYKDHYHIPLLYIGFNKTGFGITLLGIYFSIFWKLK